MPRSAPPASRCPSASPCSTLARRAAPAARIFRPAFRPGLSPRRAKTPRVSSFGVTCQAAVLFAVGAGIEFVGIVLLGFPDFVPGAVRVSRWLRLRARRAENRLRRMLRRPPRRKVVNLEALAHARATGHLSLKVSVNPEATVEEK